MASNQTDKDDVLRKEEERLLRNMTPGGSRSGKRFTLNIGKGADAALKEEEAKVAAENERKKAAAEADRKRAEEARKHEEERQKREEEARRAAASAQSAVVIESIIKPTGAEDPDKLDKEERRLRRHSQKGVKFSLAEGPVPSANTSSAPPAVTITPKAAVVAAPAPAPAPAPALPQIDKREEELKRREEELKRKELEFEMKQREAAVAAKEEQLRQRERELAEKMRKAEEEEQKRKQEVETRRRAEEEAERRRQQEVEAKKRAEEEAEKKRKQEEEKKKAATAAPTPTPAPVAKTAASPIAAKPLPATPPAAATAAAAAANATSPKPAVPTRALPTPAPLTMNISLAENARAAITRLQGPELTASAAVVLLCNIKTGTVDMQQFYESTTLEKVAEDIPEGVPRFIIYRHFIDLDGKTRKVLLMLIYLNPVSTNSPLKKLYQATKDELLKGYPSFKSMDVTSTEDLTDQKLRAKMLGKREN